MDRETEKDRILSGLTEKFRKSNEINYCEQSQMNIKYSNLIGDRQKRCIRDERSARTIDTSSFSSYLNSPSSVLSFAFQFRVFFLYTIICLARKQRYQLTSLTSISFNDQLLSFCWPFWFVLFEEFSFHFDDRAPIFVYTDIFHFKLNANESHVLGASIDLNVRFWKIVRHSIIYDLSNRCSDVNISFHHRRENEGTTTTITTDNMRHEGREKERGPRETET